jgi:hypothetical protein
MEKLTAVQWLALRYHHRQGYLSQDDIAEAKTMEKEQIINAHSTQYKGGFNSDGNFFENKITGEQYYNENYNK